jgi:hypothetical protein
VRGWSRETVAVFGDSFLLAGMLIARKKPERTPVERLWAVMVMIVDILLFVNSRYVVVSCRCRAGG